MNRSGDRPNDVEAGSPTSPILESLASEQREASVLKRRVLSALVVYAGILGTSMAMTRNSGGLGAITTDTTTNNNNDNNNAATTTSALKNTALKADVSDKLIESIKSDPFVYSSTTTTGTNAATVVYGLSGPSKSPSTGLHKPTWKPTVVNTGKPIEATGKPVENVTPIITITTTDIGTTSSSSLPLPIRSMPADFDGSGTKAGKARGGVAGAGAAAGSAGVGASNGLTGLGPRGGSGPASGGAVGVGAVYDTPLRPVGAPLDTAVVDNDAQVTNHVHLNSQLYPTINP